MPPPTDCEATVTCLYTFDKLSESAYNMLLVSMISVKEELGKACDIVVYSTKPNDLHELVNTFAVRVEKYDAQEYGGKVAMDAGIMHSRVFLITRLLEQFQRPLLYLDNDTYCSVGAGPHILDVLHGIMGNGGPVGYLEEHFATFELNLIRTGNAHPYPPIIDPMMHPINNGVQLYPFSASSRACARRMKKIYVELRSSPSASKWDDMVAFTVACKEQDDYGLLTSDDASCLDRVLKKFGQTWIVHYYVHKISCADTLNQANSQVVSHFKRLVLSDDCDRQVSGEDKQKESGGDNTLALIFKQYTKTFRWTKQRLMAHSLYLLNQFYRPENRIKVIYTFDYKQGRNLELKMLEGSIITVIREFASFAEILVFTTTPDQLMFLENRYAVKVHRYNVRDYVIGPLDKESPTIEHARVYILSTLRKFGHPIIYLDNDTCLKAHSGEQLLRLLQGTTVYGYTMEWWMDFTTLYNLAHTKPPSEFSPQQLATCPVNNGVQIYPGLAQAFEVQVRHNLQALSRGSSKSMYDDMIAFTFAFNEFNRSNVACLANLLVDKQQTPWKFVYPRIPLIIHYYFQKEKKNNRDFLNKCLDALISQFVETGKTFLPKKFYKNFTAKENEFSRLLLHSFFH